MSEMHLFETEKYTGFTSASLKKLTNVSSSKGNQEKWLSNDEKFFIKEPFQYQNVVWDDYKVELLAESIIEQLHIRTESIKQKFCTVDGRPAVYSDNFGLNGYEFLSFHRIIEKKGLAYLSMMSDIRNVLMYKVRLH